MLIGLCRWLFADAFRTDEKRVAEILALNEREAIEDPRLLVQSLVVLGVVLAAFVLSPVLGYAPSVVALLGAGLLIAITRVTTETALQDVEWPTLAFFMGLFIMVGGLVESGVLEALATQHRRLRRRPTRSRSPGVLLWGSGLLSGIVDNIPYVASMSPVVADIVGPDGEPQVLWWALALGADLGGNATLIGASANVVVAGIAARNGTPIGFWQFTRYGLVVAGATLARVHRVRLAALLRARRLILRVGALGRRAGPPAGAPRSAARGPCRSSTTTSSGLRSRAITAAHSRTVASPSTAASSTRWRRPAAGLSPAPRPAAARTTARRRPRPPPAPAPDPPGRSPARRTAAPATPAAPPPDDHRRRPRRSPATGAPRSAGPRQRRIVRARPSAGPARDHAPSQIHHRHVHKVRARRPVNTELRWSAASRPTGSAFLSTKKAIVARLRTDGILPARRVPNPCEVPLRSTTTAGSWGRWVHPLPILTSRDS